MTENGERCRRYYQSVYERNQSELSKGRALDESLHHFLDQRPSGKNLSALERAQGLASASFWLDADVVAQSELASLALGRVLHFDDAVSIELLLHLASHNPETLRWAIRYSKLFERTQSPLWLALRAALKGGDWQVFFGVCDAARRSNPSGSKQPPAHSSALRPPSLVGCWISARKSR